MSSQQNKPHWFESAPIASLAERHGTPLFLYHADTIRSQCRRFREALGEASEIYFAVKANPNPALLQLMHREELIDGLDVASSGELDLALTAGWHPQKLSYTGPAKGHEELEKALSLGVGTICVESLRELRMLVTLAETGSYPQPPAVMLRLNPELLLHAFGMQISGSPSPFGIDEEELQEAFVSLRTLLPKVRFAGLHVHAGSQCFSAKAMAKHVQQTLQLALRFEEAGFPVACINFGGGYGVSGWKPPKQLDPKSVARHLRGHLQEHPRRIQIRVEPGRALTGPSGIYVARVVNTKRSRGEDFVILDGGMHHYFSATGPELQRPNRTIWVENLSRPDAPSGSFHLTGSLCTTRDRIGSHATLATPEVGDLLGWPNAGSYGLMASPLFFLGHLTPTELLLDGEEVFVIRAPVSITAMGHQLLPD